MNNPLFIIAGERRSGTSTLAKWIEVHPELYLYPKVDQAYFLDDELRGRKEWLEGKVNFEDWEVNHPVIEYLELFQNKVEDVKIAGEKSADYFFWDSARVRISKSLPEAKIILTFRNPINRAWSHYWNEVGKGRESLSFEKALEAEPKRSKRSDYAKLHLSYLERGAYVRSLKKWLIDYPEDQVYIVILENLIKNPISELQRLYKFLGVNPDLGLENAGKRFNHNWSTIPYAFWKQSPILEKVERLINKTIRRITKRVYNDTYAFRKNSHKWERVTRYHQSEIKMKQQTRQRLLTHFEPYTSELEKYLNIDLSVWRK